MKPFRIKIFKMASYNIAIIGAISPSYIEIQEKTVSGAEIHPDFYSHTGCRKDGGAYCFGDPAVTPSCLTASVQPFQSGNALRCAG